MTQAMSEPFYPSNSDHGWAFESRYCHKCAAYFGGYCKTLIYAMANGKSAKWVKTDNDVGGECLGFKERGVPRIKSNRNRRQGELL